MRKCVKVIKYNILSKIIKSKITPKYHSNSYKQKKKKIKTKWFIETFESAEFSPLSLELIVTVGAY